MTYPIEIGIVIYPGAQLAAIYGLTDLFTIADRLNRESDDANPPSLRVTHWQLAEDGGRIVKVFDTHEGLPTHLIAVILPPALGEAPVAEHMGCLTDWLRTQHQLGTTLCSICAGAFVLAATGLLAGRSATTHWTYSDLLATRYPAVRVDTDRLIIDDGDIITGGAIMAWADLGLRLIERLIGPAIMMATARFLLVDPSGREQRAYSSFSPRFSHGDQAVLKAQHWLTGRLGERLTVSQMAARAELEERTFLRRFQRATGLKPTDYLQRLRVAKAQELLESSSQAVEQVAWQVGYEDPSAFRRVFRKLIGLTPGEYRTRFSHALRETTSNPSSSE